MSLSIVGPAPSVWPVADRTPTDMAVSHQVRQNGRMQSSEAARRAATWRLRLEREPDLTCQHPVLEKEYDLGSDTGDYTCPICGESGWGRNWPNDGLERKFQ